MMGISSSQSITFIYKRNEDFVRKKGLSEIIKKLDYTSNFLHNGRIMIFDENLKTKKN